MMGLNSRHQFNESFTAFQPLFDHDVPMPSTSRIYERKISLPYIGLGNSHNSLDESINSLNESLNSLNESLTSARPPIRRQSMPILPMPSYLDWPVNNNQMMNRYYFFSSILFHFFYVNFIF